MNPQGRIVSIPKERAEYLLSDNPTSFPNGTPAVDNKGRKIVIKKSANEKDYRKPTDEELKKYKSEQEALANQERVANQRKQKIKKAVDTLSENIEDVENTPDEERSETKEDEEEKTDSQLTDLTGIGKATAEKLNAKGIKTPEQLEEALGENDDDADIEILEIFPNGTGSVRKNFE